MVKKRGQTKKINPEQQNDSLHKISWGRLFQVHAMGGEAMFGNFISWTAFPLSEMIARAFSPFQPSYLKEPLWTCKGKQRSRPNWMSINQNYYFHEVDMRKLACINILLLHVNIKLLRMHQSTWAPEYTNRIISFKNVIPVHHCYY